VDVGLLVPRRLLEVGDIAVDGMRAVLRCCDLGLRGWAVWHELLCLGVVKRDESSGTRGAWRPFWSANRLALAVEIRKCVSSALVMPSTRTLRARWDEVRDLYVTPNQALFFWRRHVACAAPRRLDDDESSSNSPMSGTHLPPHCSCSLSVSITRCLHCQDKNDNRK